MRQKPTQKNPNKKEPKQNEAIRMRMQKFSRPGVILLATVVVIITSIVVANATQSLTTPNAAFISYSLAGCASSAPITPATNRSVLVMGCCTTFANAAPGIGQVSLLSIPNSEILWVGLESYYGATITGGATAQTAGVALLEHGPVM